MPRARSVLSQAVRPSDYLLAVRRDSDRIVSAAGGHLECDVPSCPGWTVAELVWHVGIVHAFWRQVANGTVSGPADYQRPARPGDQGLLDWFQEGVEETADVLGGIDPATAAWTWGREQNVAFIQRRVAQETTVHCWDVLTAVGGSEPIDRQLAADGVSEFLDEVLPGLSRDLDGPAQTIFLHANDIDERWMVRAGDGTCRPPQPGAVADAAVTAAASELLLLLWSRQRVDRVVVDGDIPSLERFLARASF